MQIVFLSTLLITKREKNIGGEKHKFEEIRRGIRNFHNFIISNYFRIDEAIEASAKAAWFAMKLKNGNFAPLTFYEPSVYLEGLVIENKEYQFLNKLKKNNKPAFYYWHGCLEEIDRLK